MFGTIFKAIAKHRDEKQAQKHQREVSALRRQIHALQDELAGQTGVLALVQSRVSILELERDRLIEVCERDRLRVEAESASYAAAIAIADRPNIKRPA